MKSVRPAATDHESSGELVNNHDLPVLHHVVLVAVKQIVPAQRRHQVVHQRDVARFVKRLPRGKQPKLRQDAFSLLMASLGQVNLVVLFINPVVPFGFRLLWLGLRRHPLKQRRNCVHAHIELGVIFCLPGDNKRCACLVDED